MQHRHMTRRRAKQGRSLALLLIALGLFLLVGPWLVGSLMGLLWPLFVLAPGVALFWLVKQGGKGLAWLTVPASMISMTALLLFYQNLTGHWASWAYAWPLIVPGALGMGMAVYGDLTRREGTAAWGERLAKAGVGLFLVGLVFFEMVLNLSGWLFWLAPLLLVAGGIYLLAGRRQRSRRPRPLPRQSGRLSDRSTAELERELFGEEQPKERVG